MASGLDAQSNWVKACGQTACQMGTQYGQQLTSGHGATSGKANEGEHAKQTDLKSNTAFNRSVIMQHSGKKMVTVR